MAMAEEVYKKHKIWVKDNKILSIKQDNTDIIYFCKNCPCPTICPTKRRIAWKTLGVGHEKYWYIRSEYGGPGVVEYKKNKIWAMFNFESDGLKSPIDSLERLNEAIASFELIPVFIGLPLFLGSVGEDGTLIEGRDGNGLPEKVEYTKEKPGGITTNTVTWVLEEGCRVPSTKEGYFDLVFPSITVYANYWPFLD